MPKWSVPSFGKFGKVDAPNVKLKPAIKIDPPSTRINAPALKVEFDSDVKAKSALAKSLGVEVNADGKIDLSFRIGNRIEGPDGVDVEINTNRLSDNEFDLDIDSDDMDTRLTTNDLDTISDDVDVMVENIRSIEGDIQKIEIAAGSDIDPKLKAQLDAVKAELNTKSLELTAYKGKVATTKLALEAKLDGKPPPGPNAIRLEFNNGRTVDVEVDADGAVRVDGVILESPEARADAAKDIADSIAPPTTKSKAEADADFKRATGKAQELRAKGFDFEIDADGNITIKSKGLNGDVDARAGKMQVELNNMKQKNYFTYKNLLLLAGLGFGLWTLGNYIKCEVDKKKSKGGFNETTVNKIKCNDLSDFAKSEEENVPEGKDINPDRWDFVGSSLKYGKMIEYQMKTDPAETWTNKDGSSGSCEAETDEWHLKGIIAPCFRERYQNEDGKLPYELAEEDDNSCILRWKTDIEKTESCDLATSIATTWSQIAAASKEMVKGGIKAAASATAGGLEGAADGAVTLLKAIPGGEWLINNWKTIIMVIGGIIALIVGFKLYKMFGPGGGGGGGGGE
jgi:hypothetical protein